MSVQKFYDVNSNDFSNTRYSIWDVVKKFNDSINSKSYILDAGCGNGKNMIYLQNQSHNVIGIDFSDGLLEICKEKKYKNAFHCNTKIYSMNIVINYPFLKKEFSKLNQIFKTKLK